MESIDQIQTQADHIRRRTRKLLSFTVLTLAVSTMAVNAKAQTFAEWFQQKSTQKKYLAQQLAALRVYAACTRTGNDIALNGINFIGKSLQNENDLHASFYKGLTKVNTSVKDNSQVKDIVQWQRDILRTTGALSKNNRFTKIEKKYIDNVKTALLHDCDGQITEVKIILSNGKLKMDDEERLKRIAGIHSEMESNYRFISAFSQRLQVYLIDKAKELNNIEAEKKLYGK